MWRLATFANPQGLLLGDWDYAAWRRDQLEVCSPFPQACSLVTHGHSLQLNQGFLSMTREYAAQLERDETR